MMTLEEFDKFIARLKAHDWYYEISEDHAVWKNGMEDMKDIRTIAKGNKLCSRLLTLWINVMFNDDKTNLENKVEEIRNDLIRGNSK